MKLAAILAAALIAASPATATAQMHHRAKIIRTDWGGPVAARAAEIAAMRTTGETVRIVGTCVSACTMYLGLPQTCVARDAVLGFHGPHIDTGRSMTRAEFNHWSQLMADNYPPQLRAWFMREARYRTDDYLTMTGAQVIEFGGIECK